MKQWGNDMKQFRPRGVCSREIRYSIKDDKVEYLEVIGGCEGNLKAVCELVKGMRVEEVIRRLKGIDCEGKGTSCPDQIAAALEQEYREQIKN